MREADLDMKLTDYGLQLNNLTIRLDLLKHDINDDLQKEMKELKKELSKSNDGVHLDRVWTLAMVRTGKAYNPDDVMMV